MPAIKATTDLSSIIRKATEKAQKAEGSKYDDEIINSQLKAAEERITSAENSVEKFESEKASIQDKLSPPPTKEVTGQGKKGTGSKQVVDEREKDRLESQLRATDVQVNQAKTAVESARAEAEELRGESLDKAGITQEQQGEMTSLLSQIDALQQMADDDQMDLTGDEFQNKLKEAVDGADKLAGELPDIGADVVQDFWSDVAGAFQEIEDEIVDFVTPDPYEVKFQDNYSQFFQDSEQGYNTIINHLEGQGVDRAVLADLRNSRDSIDNESNTYLGGITGDDELVMSDHMTHMNTMIEKINSGEALTNDDIVQLSLGAEETSGILAGGGSAFENVLEIPFNTIGINTNELSEKIDDPSFEEFFTNLKNLFEHPENNLSDMIGITVDEVNAIYDFSEFVTDLKGQDSISAGDLDKLLEDGNNFIDTLKNNYDFSTEDPSEYQGNGGTGARGNSRVGGGSNRRY